MVDNVTNHPNKVGITKEKPCGGNECVLCCAKEETFVCIFIDYSITKIIWTQSPWPIDPSLLSSFTNKL